MTNVLTVVLVVFSSITAPLTLNYLTQRQRHRDRAEDYARQDAVAAAVKTVADVAAASSETTIGRLDTIHTLVNSSQTAAMQDQLDARVESLAFMREIIVLNEAAGRPPTPEALSTLILAQAKVDALRSALSDRLVQSRIVLNEQVLHPQPPTEPGGGG